MRCNTSSSSAFQTSASTTNTTRSASASAAAAVRFMALLSARFAWLCRPGVSTKAICAFGSCASPIIRCRVVCGRGVTMLTFCPTSALSSVDLPTFGRPTSAAKPQRKSAEGSVIASTYGIIHGRQYALRGLLLGTPAARSLARGGKPQRRDLTGHVEGLRVGLPLDPLYFVPRQRDPAGLEILLQASLRVLE